MIKVTIQGMPAIIAALGNQAKQIPFATAKALTVTAHAVNAEMQAEMRSKIEGGPTAFTLRSLRVKAATKTTLAAEVLVREDSGGASRPYVEPLGQLYNAGARRWKKIEGLLKGRGLMPEGYQIVPGEAAPLTSAGNMQRKSYAEMLGILRSGLRNLQIYRKTGWGKELKSIGYFVIQPGHPRLLPGIYRRITLLTRDPQSTARGVTLAKTGAIEPWLIFVRPGRYRQIFNLEKTARIVVSRVFQPALDAALKQALATAR
jgi:hypothetical protein